MWFVMGRKRPVLETLRDEEPRAPVRLHDEGVVACDGLLGLRVVRRPVARLLVLLEVGDVEPRPLAVLLVPPDVLLPLRPRLPVGIGRGAVVEDPPVCGPRPGPLGRDVALLPVGLLPRGLVDPVLEAAAIDPTATERRAVRVELRIPVQERAAGDLPAAHLL